MSPGLVGASYIVASILFILSLGGLSNQESAQARGLVRHRRHGARRLRHDHRAGGGALWLVVPLIVVGGITGGWLAGRVQMTQMPNSSRRCNSFVGLPPSSSASTPISRRRTSPMRSPPGRTTS